MPLRKRWFPVTHDINADPELWELRDLYGDRAALVWLEMLSIADRNDGLIGPDSDQLRRVLASKCRVYSPKVRGILEWCLGRGWLQVDNGLRIANYWKYHRTEERKLEPSGEQIRSLPDQTDPDRSEPNQLRKEKIKSKSQLPQDFTISESVKQWGAENQIDPALHLEAFTDYHKAKASLHADWDAAFRTWLRNAKRFGNGNGTRKAQSKEDQLRAKTERILRQGL